MIKPQGLKIETSEIDGKQEVFLVVDGIRVAKRGDPDTPLDGTWVLIEPGWEVVAGEETIAIKYNAVSVH